MRTIKNNSFINASLWYIIANFLGQGIVLLSNIIFTRIMNQNDYGLYSTYYSIVALLTPFVGANLFVGLNNGYFDFKENRKDFRGAVFFLSLIVFIAFSGVFLLLQKFLLPIFNINIPFIIGIFTLIHAYSFFIVNYFNNYENMENHYKVKSLLMFFPNFLQVGLSILLILLISKNGYYERIIGSVSGVFICALIPAIVMLFNTKKLINKEYYKYALKLSVPSVLSSIAYMIMQQSDHIMITAFVGAEYTAVYSLVYVIGNVVYAFLQATGGAFQSWIYRVLDSGKTEAIKNIQKWYLFFFIIIAYGLLMISPEVIKLLAPESYWDFRYIPPFVAGSSLLVLNSMYCNIAEFNKKQDKVSLCVLAAAVINVVLNFIFIKLFGALAAAYTSLFAYICLVLFDKILVDKIGTCFYSNKYFIIYFIIICLGCILFLFVEDHIFIRYIMYFLLIIILGLYLLKNKKEFFEIIGKPE